VNANSTEVVPAYMMRGPSLISTNPPWKISTSMRRSCSIISIPFVITRSSSSSVLLIWKEYLQQERAGAARRIARGRTPECGCRVMVHRVLRAELCGRFSLSWTLGRPMLRAAFVVALSVPEMRLLKRLVTVQEIL
jgi:hypothetical protein